jgi:L-arabinose isomerase
MGIESFETSKTDVYGDLLTEKREPQKLKVGFLAGGYFEYWRMWGEAYEKSIRQDMDTVAANLRACFPDLVYPGLVDTVDKADRAGRVFKESGVNLLVLCEGTYFPDYMPLQALDHVGDVPLVLFVSQSEPVIPQDVTYPQTIRDGSLIGLSQITGAFKKMGRFRRYKVVTGGIRDESVYREIKCYADAVRAYESLRRANLGVVGYVFRGMYDFEYDLTKVKGVLGPTVTRVQVSHLVDIWNEVKDKDVDALAKDVKKRFRNKGLDDSDIYRAARLARAMGELVNRYRLDGLCYLGQHHTEAKTRTTAYLGSALLQEQGIMVISEGDVNGLIMMVAMRELTGETPFFGEWSGFDEEMDLLLVMMHGFADPALAKGEVSITPSPENWGYAGKGLSFEFTGKPGPVTIGHFIDDQEGYRMLITGGEIVDLPCLNVQEVNLRVKLKKPIKQFIKELLYAGFAHHAIIGYGDFARELSDLADLMGIKKMFL